MVKIKGTTYVLVTFVNKTILENSALQIWFMGGYVDDGRQGTSKFQKGLRFDKKEEKLKFEVTSQLNNWTLKVEELNQKFYTQESASGISTASFT